MRNFFSFYKVFTVRALMCRQGQWGQRISAHHRVAYGRVRSLKRSCQTLQGTVLRSPTSFFRVWPPVCWVRLSCPWGCLVEDSSVRFKFWRQKELGPQPGSTTEWLRNFTSLSHRFVLCRSLEDEANWWTATAACTELLSTTEELMQPCPELCSVAHALSVPCSLPDLCWLQKLPLGLNGSPDSPSASPQLTHALPSLRCLNLVCHISSNCEAFRGQEPT